MSIWKDNANTAKPEPARFEAPPLGDIHNTPAQKQAPAEPAPAPVRAVEPAAKESLIASDLTIEGKIEGAGHVRIAGKFKGDVRVQGNLTIDQGAKVSGGVSASRIAIAGELEGNIDAAKQVELQPSGAVTGDIKASTLTVAAGSRIRGHVDCGWEGAEEQRGKKGDSAAA